MAIKPSTTFRTRVGAINKGDTNAQMRAIQQRFQDIVRNYVEVTPDALLYALEPTFALSQQFVPVDTGDLRASGYLEVIGRGRRPIVQIGYGKAGRPPYAVIVHENLEAHHAAPTRAKFLEEALNRTESLIPQRIAEFLRGVLGS